MNILCLKPSKPRTFARCAVCGYEGHSLFDHLQSEHGLSGASYIEKYPQAPTVSNLSYEEFITTQVGVSREAPGTDLSIHVKLGQISMPVNIDVPSDACLPVPKHFILPRYGDLGSDVEDALISMKKGRSTYISGPPGTGKDALIYAFCAMTRRPSLSFTIRPDTDIQSWLSFQAFNMEGTYYKEGLLLQALRDGYTTPSGRTVPYLILLSDFDRANREQSEVLRSIIEDHPRVQDLNGDTHKVLPGTLIVATANTQGGGDYTGRLVSANPIDSSLMNRFERKLIFHLMDWKDESKIVRLKFPTLTEMFPKSTRVIGQVTAALRLAITKDELFGEFSHRDVCNWASACEDLMEEMPSRTDGLLLRAARSSFMAGFPDPANREIAKRLIDPLLKNGAIRSSRKGEVSELVDL